ncbi:hypothetical protein CYR55_10605 [Chimaeribacter californicus]|uniref:Transcriptional regulator n=1 Tax=Chimaeribacter californicus TaxID=2060067 RepID=A0A2N5E7B4_9GAMM|nr:hypothetical protein CYR55_10605 [Chimaeribacter californicus]
MLSKNELLLLVLQLIILHPRHPQAIHQAVAACSYGAYLPGSARLEKVLARLLTEGYAVARADHAGRACFSATIVGRALLNVNAQPVALIRKRLHLLAIAEGSGFPALDSALTQLTFNLGEAIGDRRGSVADLLRLTTLLEETARQISALFPLSLTSHGDPHERTSSFPACE